MALAFLLDEHLRGMLWTAIQRHNTRTGDSIDVVCVGDFPDLPFGSADANTLVWAERNNRVLISRDYRTMVHFFRRHLRAGHHCPRLIFLRAGHSIRAIICALSVVASAGNPADFLDQIDYLP